MWSDLGQPQLSNLFNFLFFFEWHILQCKGCKALRSDIPNVVSGILKIFSHILMLRWPHWQIKSFTWPSVRLCFDRRIGWRLVLSHLQIENAVNCSCSTWKLSYIQHNCSSGIYYYLSFPSSCISFLNDTYLKFDKKYTKQITTGIPH